MVGQSSTRARALVIISTSVLALVLLLATAVNAVSGSASVAGVEYQVGAGDTLWEIASDRTTRGGDVRGTVASIKEANGLESSLIHPGQIIVVPEGG